MKRKHLIKESALVDAAFNLVMDCLAKDYVIGYLSAEVSVGRTIADIAGFMCNRRTIFSPPEPFTTIESGVVAWLRKCGSTRIDLLESACGMSNGTLRRGSLDRLYDWNVIQAASGGKVSLSKKLMFPFSLVAIEAKLLKWKDALNQAIDYRKYADQSFVLLPREFAAPAIQASEEFVSNRIGLLVYHGTNVRCEIPAPNVPTNGWRREFIFSRLANEFNQK